MKLPREERAEIAPPAHDHVATDSLLASTYELPLLVLDATGMRVGDSRDSCGATSTSHAADGASPKPSRRHERAAWVNVPPAVYDAVLALCPRDDRSPTRPVLEGFVVNRFRTAIARACTAVGVPVFSPHDIHRRMSLMHLAGVPWARIGGQVGQRDLAVTANTYSYVPTDETEVDLVALCGVPRKKRGTKC